MLVEFRAAPCEDRPDRRRRAILAFLRDPVLSCRRREDGVCACDLETFLGLTQPTVSHHMQRLVAAGLVSVERRGRWSFYELVSTPFEELAHDLLSYAAAAREATTAGERVH
jgi:ArsR family transcriptional regulator